jgi:hypothetical protein
VPGNSRAALTNGSCMDRKPPPKLVSLMVKARPRSLNIAYSGDAPTIFSTVAILVLCIAAPSTRAAASSSRDNRSRRSNPGVCTSASCSQVWSHREPSPQLACPASTGRFLRVGLVLKKPISGPVVSASPVSFVMRGRQKHCDSASFQLQCLRQSASQSARVLDPGASFRYLVLEIEPVNAENPTHRCGDSTACV